MNRISTLLLCAAGGALASPAAAAVTVYTSQAAFDAAVASETAFTFDEGNSSNHFHVAANPYTQSGITFTADTTAADIANGGTPIIFLIGNAATPNYGQDFLSFQNTDVGQVADITSAGVMALGFTYGTYVADGAATVSVDGGSPIALAVTSMPAFIGFTSTTPITDLNIVFPGGYTFDLTNVSFAGAVPEPASWAMMLAGFALVGGALRRSRMIATAAYA